MIADLPAMVAASPSTIPLGVPYVDEPVSRNVLKGLEAHRWGKQRYASVFHVDGPGTALNSVYFWARRATDSISMSNHVYFTQHAGTIVISYTGVWLRYPDELDPPKADETCFTSLAIRWTARRLFLREIDVAATRRANPWLDRRPTSDDSCPLALGHLSPADQARLTIRWGREESVGLAPMPPPPIPAIGPPYVLDENGHLINESALKHR